ncbi:hypothetical protein A2U01_0111892, partial [Trifolium medium]|nr:hypothetical protein [Trifolium medium]
SPLVAYVDVPPRPLVEPLPVVAGVCHCGAPSPSYREPPHIRGGTKTEVGRLRKLLDDDATRRKTSSSA